VTPKERWWSVNLDQLCALEADSLATMAGNGFVHGDVRSDNILLCPEGQVVFVDWTSCCFGPPWIDLVCMAPSVELEGGGSPERLLALAGLDPPADQLAPVVAGVAGYLTSSAQRPDPPGMPTVRSAQRAKAKVAVRWLQRIMGSGSAVGEPVAGPEPSST